MDVFIWKKIKLTLVFFLLGIDFMRDLTLKTVNGKVHIDLDPDYQVYT